MSRQNKKSYIAKIVSVLALVVFAIVIIKSTVYSPEISVKSATTVINAPSRLAVPSLDIDAKVQKVGITLKGNMATPNNFVDVGWYEYGPLPGQLGSAVIAGHVNNGLAFPAVFSNLKNIETGADIYVETLGKNTLHFVVVGTKVYDFDAKADEVFKQDDGKFLKLITCTGTWSDQYKTHDKRLVVTAMLVE
ncbi:class F sortase [Candidatus Nomurabacteria bacterium]|nr:class F sortase [Candidatus Nomurabacteria bacterium]